MTPQAQADALQAAIDPGHLYFSFFVDVHGSVACMTEGRLGIMSDYWMRPNAEGQSAAFSVGSVEDDYGIFGELEARASDPARRLTGVRVHVVPQNSQPNIAADFSATNSTYTDANGDAVGNVPILLRGVGIALDEAVDHFAIGKLSAGPYRQLFPQFE